MEKTKTARRASVKPKIAEMVSTTDGKQLTLNVSPTVPAFRAYLSVSKVVNGVLSGAKDLNSIDTMMEGLDGIWNPLYGWLIEYGGVTEADLDQFTIWEIVSVFRQAAMGFVLPQTKSVP